MDSKSTSKLGDLLSVQAEASSLFLLVVVPTVENGGHHLTKVSIWQQQKQQRVLPYPKVKAAD